MVDFDPTEYAEVGEGPGDPSTDGAESSDSGLGNTGNPFIDGLFRTEPHKPLEVAESPFDLQNGGLPRIWRGVQKWAGTEGQYAILDIVLGLIELWVKAKTEGVSSGQGQASTDSLDFDPSPGGVDGSF